MPFLAINGITLPVRGGSLKRDEIEIGERGRMFDGSPWSGVRARKRRWAFGTPPMTQVDAAAWRALLSGVGHTADFEADTWTAQGVQGVLSGTAARSTVGEFAGSYSLLIPAGTENSCAWTFPAWSAWTVAVRDVLHFMWKSDLPGKVLVNGSQADWSLSWFTWSSGLLTLSGNGASGNHFLDDLLVLPFAVPASWAAQMAAHPRALLPLPTLEASGDMVGAPLGVVARVTGSEQVQCMLGGSWTPNAEQLDVELEEA